MYNVTLINLTADARTVAGDAQVDLHDVSPAVLEGLLRNFCEIDPIANAAGDTEIRVQARQEKFLLRTEQKKLILYDVNRRDLPAQMLGVEQAMLELDGSAAAARNQSILQARAEAGPVDTGPVLPVRAPPAQASRPRMIGLILAAGLLLAAILWLSAPFGSGGPPPGFKPVGSAERGRLQPALIGVYLTGSEPGQHGIVITGPGEMKLFELGRVEAPRVVYAGYQLGRIGPRLCLATDQPGGVVEVAPDGSLRYGGETYRRLP